MWITKKEHDLLRETIGILERNIEDLQKKNQFLMERVLGTGEYVEEPFAPKELDFGDYEEELRAGTILKDGKGVKNGESD